MKKLTVLLTLLIALMLTIAMASCGASDGTGDPEPISEPAGSPDISGASDTSPFSVQFLCTSPEIYRIDYVADLDGRYLCRGGIANFDHVPLNDDPDTIVYFSKDDLEGQEEGELSLELHLYGENEERELAILDPVTMPARLGERQVVDIDGSSGDGFTARLAGQ